MPPGSLLLPQKCPFPPQGAIAPSAVPPPESPRRAGGSFVLLPARAAPRVSRRADLCLRGSRPRGRGGATRRLPNLHNLHNSSSRPPLPPPCAGPPPPPLHGPPRFNPGLPEPVPGGSVTPRGAGRGQPPAAPGFGAEMGTGTRMAAVTGEDRVLQHRGRRGSGAGLGHSPALPELNPNRTRREPRRRRTTVPALPGGS